MKGLTLRNTSRYPTAEVRRLVHAALAETDLHGRRVCVNVKNSRGYPCSGMFYSSVPGVSNAPADADHLITIRLGEAELFPAEWRSPYKRSPMGGETLACWRECLVAVAAHEGRHLTQHVERLSGRREVDADTHAAWMLRRYRAEVAS